MKRIETSEDANILANKIAMIVLESTDDSVQAVGIVELVKYRLSVMAIDGK